MFFVAQTPQTVSKKHNKAKQAEMRNWRQRKRSNTLMSIRQTNGKDTDRVHQHIPIDTCDQRRDAAVGHFALIDRRRCRRCAFSAAFCALNFTLLFFGHTLFNGIDLLGDIKAYDSRVRPTIRRLQVQLTGHERREQILGLHCLSSLRSNKFLAYQKY